MRCFVLTTLSIVWTKTVQITPVIDQLNALGGSETRGTNYAYINEYWLSGLKYFETTPYIATPEEPSPTSNTLHC